MQTDSLIDGLVADFRPVQRWAPGAALLALALLGGVELAVFLLVGAARPDLAEAATGMMLWWKLASLLALAAVGVATAVLSLSPDRSPRQGLTILMGVIGVVILSGILLGTGAHGTLGERLAWQHGVECLTKMVALSVPPMILLGLAARRGGPTDLAGTALAVGVGAAGWGAFVFAFACPSDDPLYILFWYAIGCGAVAGIARLALPRLIRW